LSGALSGSGALYRFETKSHISLRVPLRSASGRLCRAVSALVFPKAGTLLAKELAQHGAAAHEIDKNGGGAQGHTGPFLLILSLLAGQPVVSMDAGIGSKNKGARECVASSEDRSC